MINKHYSVFFEGLNKKNIEWCLIKDYDYLMRVGYDNEVDIIAYGADRENIRTIAKKLGWYESSLNSANTHLIFWRFEGSRPFRVDVHVNQALATAVPWFDAEDILADKVKKGEVYVASPKWELAILLLSSFRGRKPKPHRMRQAKKLHYSLLETAALFKGKLNQTEVEQMYDLLVLGKVVRFSMLKRLGIFGIIEEQFLKTELFFIRLFNLSPVVIVQHSRRKRLIETLLRGKIHVMEADNLFESFGRRIFSDVVVMTSSRVSDSSVKETIHRLWP